MSFNWTLIKERYMNAYINLIDEEDLSEGVSSNSLYDPSTDAVYDLRKLYDFFDAKEIECYVIPGENGYEKIPVIVNSFRGEPVESRTEAEAVLFTKAFELLCQQLTNPMVHL